MKYLIDVMFRSKKDEAWFGLTVAVMLALTAVWTTWITAAPDNWAEISWKQWVMLGLITMSSGFQAAKTYMSKTWNNLREGGSSPAYTSADIMGTDPAPEKPVTR